MIEFEEAVNKKEPFWDATTVTKIVPVIQAGVVAVVSAFVASRFGKQLWEGSAKKPDPKDPNVQELVKGQEDPEKQIVTDATEGVAKALGAKDHAGNIEQIKKMAAEQNSGQQSGPGSGNGNGNGKGKGKGSPKMSGALPANEISSEGNGQSDSDKSGVGGKVKKWVKAVKPSSAHGSDIELQRQETFSSSTTTSAEQSGSQNKPTQRRPGKKSNDANEP
ncbi:MAG: hypothetical protein Q9162_007727 [Coniocarpon cinnabarinum]